MLAVLHCVRFNGTQSTFPQRFFFGPQRRMAVKARRAGLKPEQRHTNPDDFA
jgi:hypothetical protein